MSENQYDKSWADLRKAVFTRDRHQCVNCLGNVDQVLELDPDHTVPRGVGGSDRLSNVATLCRQCHKAKHGDGLAPTVRLESSGEMDQTEFMWFKHLMNEMIPVLAQMFDVRLEPKFGLTENDRWHLPLGDLRRLDQQIVKGSEIEQYRSLRAAQYM